MAEYSVVGKSVPQADWPAKVTGEATYAADIHLPEMLIGKILTSPYPFARILSIDTGKAKKLPGIEAVLTAQDVVQHPFGVFLDDEVPLAEEFVRYAGDEVAAVAAVDEETAEEALDLIEVEYTELAPVLNIEAAIAPGAPAVHPEREKIKNNTFYHIEFERGGGEAAFKQADVIVEKKFCTQAVHQSYIETMTCVASWDTSNRLTLWGGNQRPYVNKEFLAKALGIPVDQVRIISPSIGGSFGGKCEMHPYYPIAALLSKKSGRPVKIAFTREEDFISGRIRVSEIIDVRMGFKKNGTMIAKSMDVTANSGAYAGQNIAVVKGGISRADSLYRLPNIKLTARLAYTNTIPRGAFRGFGTPQMQFAVESLIDIAAEKLGMDPIELRLKNAVQKGDVTQHGLILNSCAFADTLELATEASGWHKKKQQRNGKYGIGIACQIHHSSNRNLGRAFGYDGSAATINIDQQGKVKVTTGEVDIGEGMNILLAQVAAEELGVDLEDVKVLPLIDTDNAPFSIGTIGSRVAVLGGGAVQLAAVDARKQIVGYTSRKLGVKAGDLSLKNGKFYVACSTESAATFGEIAREMVMAKGGVPITGRGEYKTPDSVVLWDETTYGNYSLTYTFSTAIAEVEVDSETGIVDVLDIWHILDIGKRINPKSCEGQVEGGAMQGLGYTLIEDYVWNNGILQNTNFTDYKIPMAEGTPRIHSLWIEKPDPGTPYGAKGIGELGLSPIPPAIANAVYNAVGVRMTSLPITAEKLLEAIHQK